MTPYLVKGTVTVTPYMGDTHSIEDIRIVIADDENHARLKYEEYWSSKTSEYSIYYHADSQIMETVK